MARHNSAYVLRSLRNYGEFCFGVDRRVISAPKVASIRRFGGSQDSSRLLSSFRSCSKPVAEFRRMMSSYEENHDRRILELVRGKDRLIFRGCKFHGHHGVLEEEKTLGQKFVLDMDAWLDLREAGESDNLKHTVSYADLFSTVEKILEGPAYNLLETVANDVACSVLTGYPRITDVRVRIYKFSPPVAGFVDKLGIEIYRTSSDFVSKV